jgi:gamma-glutamyltranspeptidase/glutathione hydrolase
MTRQIEWRLPAAAAAALLVLAGCGGNAFRADAGSEGACQTVSGADPVVIGSGLPGDPAAPEPSSGYRLGKTQVLARDYMVVSANPLATRAGCNILKAGGSAVDAAVAVQAVLGLVEPQSSGLGGGAFLLYYDADTRQVQAYDGRETAPAAADANYLRWISNDDRTPPQPSARASGRAVGTPGVVRMLDLAHRDHGVLPWASLFEEGMALARNGFPISGRMADALDAAAPSLARDAEAAALFLNPDGSAKALGTRFVNQDYADTLARIAGQGAEIFYSGPLAQAIVDKVAAREAADGSPTTPSLMTVSDLARYEARRRAAVCTTYRAYWVCGMPPPSSGGITVASALGILEHFPLGRHGPSDVDGDGGRPSLTAVHLVSEAERLAYADRDRYIADTDHVPLPGGTWETLLDKGYLASRAALITPEASMGTAQPGQFGTFSLGSDSTPESGTTHVSIVDRYGNAVAMTSSIEASMGSYHVVEGFLLNNQLTDFSASPHDANGAPIANRVEPGKRPRSSMAPTLVFHKNDDGSRGEFFMATGSPGGSAIIQYVVKTIVAVVDWGLDAQQATSLVNFGAANTATTNVGGEHPNIDAGQDGKVDPLVVGLRKLGHTVSTHAQTSGIGTIIRTTVQPGARLAGGADPRREGMVLGDVLP